MPLKKDIQQLLLKTIAKSGTRGATITEIEKGVKFERHTISKYLAYMQAHGLVYHREIGKAKLWHINQAPIHTVLNAGDGKKTMVEEVLTQLCNKADFGLVIVDQNYVVLYANEWVDAYFPKVHGKKFYQEVLGEDNPMRLAQTTKVLFGKKKKGEEEFVDVKNRIIHVASRGLRNPDGSESFLLTLRDVTVRRKSQELVLEQKALLEAEREALNKAAIVVETDLDGKIIYANDKFVEVSGYSRKELLGKTHKIVNSKQHHPEFFKKMWNTIRKGHVWSGIICNKTKNGRLYWLDSVISPVYGPDGKIVKFIAIRYNLSPWIKKVKRSGPARY